MRCIFDFSGSPKRKSRFAWLEKAYQERSNALAYLVAGPMLDRFHSDPRYQGLLRRIGLAE